MSKPMTFDCFVVTTALMQAKEQDKEIKQQLRESYGAYVQAEEEIRTEWEENLKKKTKPLFQAVSAFYNTSRPHAEQEREQGMQEALEAIQATMDSRKDKGLPSAPSQTIKEITKHWH